MTPLTARLAIYGSVALLAFAGFEALQASARSAGRAGEVEAEAKRRQTEMVAFYHEKVENRLAYGDSLAAARKATREALGRFSIVSREAIAIDGVTVAAPAQLIDAALKCAQLEVATGQYVISVHQEEAAAVQVFAADSALTNATKQNRPGWLKRTWHAIEAPVMFTAGVVTGVVIAGTIRPP